MIFDPFGDFQSRGYLRNSQRLKDPAEIKEFEHRYFILNLEEAVDRLRNVERIAYNDVLSTHKILFQNVYPWAGQDRAAVAPEIAITKAGRNDMFAHPDDARKAVAYALELGQDKDVMVKRPGEVMGYLAHGHPFLEGNGRTIMVVHNELAHRADFSIDWRQSDKDAYLQALTRELERPGRGELDNYIRPFISPPLTYEQSTSMLRVMPALGGKEYFNRPETRLPLESGVYHGRIVGVEEKYIIQEVTENAKPVHIRHERLVLNGDDKHMQKGANVTISYPYNRVGIVKEFGAKELEPPQLEKKGYAADGF